LSLYLNIILALPQIKESKSFNNFLEKNLSTKILKWIVHSETLILGSIKFPDEAETLKQLWIEEEEKIEAKMQILETQQC